MSQEKITLNNYELKLFGAHGQVWTTLFSCDSSKLNEILKEEVQYFANKWNDSVSFEYTCLSEKEFTERMIENWRGWKNDK